jgi:hypothetical protein
MYAFTGSGGRLKHIERIITSILQRAPPSSISRG